MQALRTTRTRTHTRNPVYLRCWPLLLTPASCAGKLRVTASDIRRGGQVQLLLKATGHVRVTINGNVIANLSITGRFPKLNRCLLNQCKGRQRAAEALGHVRSPASLGAHITHPPAKPHRQTLMYACLQAPTPW